MAPVDTVNEDFGGNSFHFCHRNMKGGEHREKVKAFLKYAKNPGWIHEDGDPVWIFVNHGARASHHHLG